jgi:hypothetical protein
MTIDEINRTLRNIIRTELGLPEHQVRPANTDSPTGSNPFATVLISDAISDGFDDVVVQDAGGNNVTETASGLRKLIVSIQFFRANAITYASRLRAKLQLNSAREKFALNGLGYVRCSGVQVLSTLQNTFWEERAKIDLDVYVVAKEIEVINTYGEFPLTIDTETVHQVGVVLEP